jgi:hypothetical protein
MDLGGSLNSWMSELNVQRRTEQPVGLPHTPGPGAANRYFRDSQSLVMTPSHTADSPRGEHPQYRLAGQECSARPDQRYEGTIRERSGQ